MIENSKNWAKARNLYRERNEVHGCEEWRIPVASSFEFNTTNRESTEFSGSMELEARAGWGLSWSQMVNGHPLLFYTFFQDPDGELLRSDLSEQQAVQRLSSNNLDLGETLVEFVPYCI